MKRTTDDDTEQCAHCRFPTTETLCATCAEHYQIQVEASTED